ncbi:MAG: GWxTD domain-containing protein [Saprospiraceae bacterium]|nr:GWxTD domain-containing protein [Saprospiraceae bacterium]
MKKLFLIFPICFFVFQGLCLEISIDASSFKNADKTYLETYIRILGQTVEFKSAADGSSMLQAGVELTIILSQGDNIVSFERFVLNSPKSKTAKDFLDVKRFALPEGEYTLKLEANDIHNADNKLELEKKVVVFAYSGAIHLSDIQLFNTVTTGEPDNILAKNGLLMEPFTYGFVGAESKVLNIYCEVYKNNELADNHFIRYAILEGYSDMEPTVSFQKFKKLSAKQTEPLLLKLPIDKLPSGNYHALVEIFDKSKNTIETRKIDFVRSNPEFDREYWMSYNKDEDYSFVAELSEIELDYALRAISAIVYEPKKSLMNFIIKEAPIRAQKKFLLEFWKENAPSSPEFSYYKFMEVAKAIDLEFNSNVGHGFETDRGYMFLRYGKPSNVLSIDTEPDSYPYEIWYYNYLKETNQTNVRFIFYNKSLVHNDYSILHSTCIGERQNPAWEVELYRKGLEVPNNNAVDDLTVGDSWQRNARRYFNDF